MKLLKKGILSFLLIFLFINPTYAGKSADLKRINSLYDEGLLTRTECIEAKKKILGRNSSPKCKKTSTKKAEKHDYSAQGTAFFISSKGYLLTNSHVISPCDNNVKIKYKRKEIDVRVVARDKYLDLALLKADEIINNKYVSLSNKQPEKLQRVIAVGYPFGKYVSDDLKFTSGIISSLKGPSDTSTMIQIDAALNPGNSGGPIVDEDDGTLVGVANMKLDASISEGTNFAIKASSVKNFLLSNDVKSSTTFLSFNKSRSNLLKLLEDTTVFAFCE